MFFGGKKLTKSQKAQGAGVAYTTHIFWPLKTNGLNSYDSGGIPRDRRLLHIICCALGGPILGFWGVGLVAELGFT